MVKNTTEQSIFIFYHQEFSKFCARSMATGSHTTNMWDLNKTHNVFIRYTVTTLMTTWLRLQAIYSISKHDCDCFYSLKLMFFFFTPRLICVVCLFLHNLTHTHGLLIFLNGRCTCIYSGKVYICTCLSTHPVSKPG